MAHGSARLGWLARLGCAYDCFQGLVGLDLAWFGLILVGFDLITAQLAGFILIWLGF